MMLGRAILALVLLGFASCSFDYGSVETLDETRPDLIMTDVEYVRVRDGKPIVRLQAESAERFEKTQKMIVTSPRFEQFRADGTGGAKGVAASAEIDLASGDVLMSGGVSVSVPDEDVLIETEALSWRDEEKGLTGPENGAVLIKKGDGTYLSGIGFAADARSRSWDFTGTVTGTWVDSDEDAEAVPVLTVSESGAPAVSEEAILADISGGNPSSTGTADSENGIVPSAAKVPESIEGGSEVLSADLLSADLLSAGATP